MALFRVEDVVTYDLTSLQLSAINVPQNTAVTVIPDHTAQRHANTEAPDPTGDVTQTTDAFGLGLIRKEVAYIEIFNAGPGNAYVAFGRPADAITNFNAYLAPGSMYEIKTRELVSVFASVGACLIGRNIIVRKTASDNFSS